MKVWIAIALTLAAVPALAGDSIEQLAWMEGTWSSVIDGTRTTEAWTDTAGGLMLGVHKDVSPKRTAFEFLRIAEQDGALAYIAQPGGGPATIFPLRELSADRVVFENLEHDFPQRIIYWIQEMSLCARIEGPMNGEEASMEWCWQKEKD